MIDWQAISAISSILIIMVTVSTLYFSLKQNEKLLILNDEAIKQNEETLSIMKKEKRPVIEIKNDDWEYFSTSTTDKKYNSSLNIRLINTGGKTAIVKSVFIFGKVKDETINDNRLFKNGYIIPPGGESNIALDAITETYTKKLILNTIELKCQINYINEEHKNETNVAFFTFDLIISISRINERSNESDFSALFLYKKPKI